MRLVSQERGGFILSRVPKPRSLINSRHSRRDRDQIRKLMSRDGIHVKQLEQCVLCKTFAVRQHALAPHGHGESLEISKHKGHVLLPYDNQGTTQAAPAS